MQKGSRVGTLYTSQLIFIDDILEAFIMFTGHYILVSMAQRMVLTYIFLLQDKLK